jgi:cytochrome c oxidase assembly protein subunit 15
MDLHWFKQIYFVEWFHRIVGRSIGLIFAGPLAYFWYKGFLMPRMKLCLGGLFLFGGL